jgi:hypothetical protein
MKYGFAICWSFLFLLSWGKLLGSHSVGMDITYTYVSGPSTAGEYTYLVKVSFYRDCSGVSAPFSMALDARSASEPTKTFNLPYISEKELTVVCPPGKTTCQGGAFYGVKEYIYQGQIKLVQKNDWILSASFCCRNYAITTINNPGGSFIYVETFMDNLSFGAEVNSPQFTNPPVIQPFVNHLLNYNHGAYDPDGDQLSYELITPKTDANYSVSYKSGFSSTTPFGTSAGNPLNQATGDLTIVPPVMMVTILAVKVKEFRNGKMIGYVIRDIQVNVTNNSNKNPGLGGINGTANYAITAYAGNLLCFNIPGSDPDGDKITLTTNLGIVVNGATFTAPPNPTLSPDGQVCWTPAAADIGTYCFTVTATDDACNRPGNKPPFPGITIKSYCITVEDNPCTDCPLSFAPIPGKPYVLSAWVKEANKAGALAYSGPEIFIHFPYAGLTFGPYKGKGNIIDGWQRLEETFTIPVNAKKIEIELNNAGTNDVFFDDIRFSPFDATMKSFVYDPLTMRLMAELDENNYASFYEYDEEGALILVKKETERGIMTIQESRNAIQKKN